MNRSRIYPERHGSKGWLVAVVILIIILFIALPSIAAFVTDWLWFKELGRGDIYAKMYWGHWLLGIGVGLIFFLLVYLNISIAMRVTPEALWSDFSQRLSSQSLDLVSYALRKFAFWGITALTLVFAVSLGISAAGYWPTFLLFLHSQTVGTVDPIFQRDIGFYLFRLPLWQLFISWLQFALIFALVVTAVIYLATRTIRAVRGVPVFSSAVQWHLSALLSLIFVLKAMQYYFGRFALLASANDDFIGPSYADVHARIPCLAFMAVLALLAAVVILLGVRRKNILLPIGAIITLVIASFLLLGLYPSLLQQFRVTPNQLALETPYLKNHINLTRQAYGLDKVIRQQFKVLPRLSNAAVADSPGTVSNIRLWDYRPLLTVYNQRQTIRTYYDFVDVDVDRYEINGVPRQVMLSARELNVDNIPGAKTWVNQRLIYTHGYGLAMSPVNEVDPNKGEPEYFIDNIPPESTIPSLQVKQPGIYFGQLGGDYVVVRSGQQEFDYSSGDQNVTTTYQGTAGIPLGNPFVRLLAASRFSDLNLLISGYITAESRLVFNRQILKRAQTLAPFLQFDTDPYLVLGTDGKLYWILDAYTTSTKYPYSRLTALQVFGGQAMNINYLRNSVKVVIDAYNGSADFYLADTNDPIIHAWQEIFPTMFQPLSAMPAGLLEHVRVPEGLFNTTSEIYRRYHLTADQVNVFYQNEDLWDIPIDLSGSNQGSEMQAYYVIMSLPGKRDPEYLLIRPYTPHGKKNMIAWMSARNNQQNYGELLIYEFPKDRQISGPEQVHSTINSEPEISSAISLWSRAGSRVIWGNLLVIPIDSTLLYVRPLYLQSENSPIPELQRIIVTDQERVIMRNTLDEALSALTAGTAAPPSDAPVTTPATAPPPKPTVALPPTATQAEKALARSALQHFQSAQDALKRGDWTTYGNEMEGVRKDLEQLNK